LSTRSVVVFIDYENIHISLSKKDKQIDPNRIDIFEKTASTYGEVISIVPIAQWANYRTHEEAFAGHGINPFSVAQGVKNSSDIALVVECMIACYEKEYDIFIIFSDIGCYDAIETNRVL